MIIAELILKTIKFPASLDFTLNNEQHIGSDYSGTILFFEHKIRLHDYIKSYQYTKRDKGEYWVCLKINIIEKKEYEVLKLINHILEQNNFIIIPNIELFDKTDDGEIFNSIHLEAKQRMDFIKINSGLSIQIVNFD
jgi:hypothetical protein